MVTKKKTIKTNGTYQLNVLDVNKKLKENQSSLGGATRKLLLFEKEIKMHKDFVRVLRASLKGNNNNVYKFLNEKVRKTKNGTCPFYVLQCVNKNLPELMTIAGFVKPKTEKASPRNAKVVANKKKEGQLQAA